MFGSFGMPELIIIFLIILLLFGARKIPEIARGLGGGIKEFKKTMKGDSEKKAEDVSEAEKIPEGTKKEVASSEAQEKREDVN